MDDELRLQRVASGAWILISDNSAYERELIKPDDLASLEIIGQCWRKVGRFFEVVVPRIYRNHGAAEPHQPERSGR